jgi:hypothetical protein
MFSDRRDVLVRTITTRALVLVGAAALLTSGLVNPAAAAGLPSAHQDATEVLTIEVVGSDGPTTLGYADHQCEVMGNDGVREAVHCADLMYHDRGGGLGEFWARGQALCQPIGGGYPKQCAGIRQNPQLWDTRYSQPVESYIQACGRYTNQDPPCPSDGLRFYSYSGNYLYQFDPWECIYLYAKVGTDGGLADFVILPVSAKKLGPAAHQTRTFRFCDTIVPG